MEEKPFKFVKCISFILLIAKLSSSTPNNPCPNIFQYKFDGYQYYGQIQLDSIKVGQTVHIIVNLSVPVLLPTSYIGKLDLLESREQAVQSVFQNRPLLYKITFPSQNPLPRLNQIVLDNAIICRGITDENPPNTKIQLYHTFYTKASGLPNRFNEIRDQYFDIPNGFSGYITSPPKLGNPFESLNDHPISFSRPISSIHLTSNQQNPFQIPQINLDRPQNVFQIPQLNFNQPENPFTIPEQNTNRPFQMQPEKPFQRPQQNINRPIQTPNQPEFQQNTNPMQTPDLENIFEIPSQNSNRPIQTQNQPEDTSQTSQIRPNQQVTRPINNFGTQAPPTNTAIECGKQVHSPVTQFVIHGSPTNKGEWPWLAAIFVNNEQNRTFQCGGTILSAKVTVTASHCLFREGQKDPINPNEIFTAIGRYDITNWSEIGTDLLPTERIDFPPNYQKLETFEMDIAVVIHRRPISFTEFPHIRPICLWSATANILEIEGRMGTVVGWGVDELGNKPSPAPKKIEVGIVSRKKCIRGSTQLETVTTSNTNFCAGERDGRGPCTGDSGSGLVIFNNGKWELRGVVAGTVQGGVTKTSELCKLEEYVVYVDIKAFEGWLRNWMTI